MQKECYFSVKSCCKRFTGQNLRTVCNCSRAWCCRILLFEEKSKQEKNKATGPPPKRTMD